MKNKKILYFILIVAIAILIGIALSMKKTTLYSDDASTKEIQEEIKDMEELPLFAKGLAEVGISADEMGFHSFSPDGKYFIFNTFTQGKEPATTSYVMELRTGTITTLPGIPERGIDDTRVVQLYTSKGTVLFWLETGIQKLFALGDNIFMTTLSPDGKTLLVNTTEGLKKADVETGTVTTFSSNQYDGAYAWFSDSVRILGFEQTGENLFEAGKGRRLGIWNVSNGIFTPLETSITDKTISYIEWVIPDRIARVNTGWDDASFDYLVDVDTGAVIIVGDTSAALMGGTVTDSTRGLFATVGSIRDGDTPRVVMYKGLDEIGSTTLSQNYFRESVHIVDENTLLYIRKTYADGGIKDQAVVKLNINTGIESILKALPMEYADLSLAPNHTTWVVNTKTGFITGSL